MTGFRGGPAEATVGDGQKTALVACFGAKNCKAAVGRTGRMLDCQRLLASNWYWINQNHLHRSRQCYSKAPAVL